jgi:5-methylcytosine-specific restriction endonuclease McrA
MRSRDGSMQAKDAAWSKAVKIRDNGYCMMGYKGCQGVAHHSHHVFTRTFKKLRHDVDNGISVCSVCHDKVGSQGKRAYDFIKSRIGETWWNRLIEKKRTFYG